MVWPGAKGLVVEANLLLCCRFGRPAARVKRDEGGDKLREGALSSGEWLFPGTVPAAHSAVVGVHTEVLGLRGDGGGDGRTEALQAQGSHSLPLQPH